MEYIHQSNHFHLNLSTNNIYFNTRNEIFFSAVSLLIKIDYYDPIQIWYSAPELSYINNLYNNNINKIDVNLCKADIWSIGCIICEIFFLATPLIQCLGSQDKMLKIIEVILILYVNRLLEYQE